MDGGEALYAAPRDSSRAPAMEKGRGCGAEGDGVALKNYCWGPKRSREHGDFRRLGQWQGCRQRRGVIVSARHDEQQGLLVLEETERVVREMWW